MITYGDGSSASGNVGTDVVEIGGIQVQNQAVELANKLSSQFQGGAGDGLLGLGFSNINTVRPHPVQTPVENMIAQASIGPRAELFTAYLGSYHDKNDADGGQSFYTFGYIDHQVVKATGNQVYYTPIDESNGFWQFSSTASSVNGQTNSLPGRTAIADTGTTLALVDDQTCKNVYAAIPGAKFVKSYGGYVFPTSTTQASLPVVQFDVGGHMFTINKEDLTFTTVGNGYSFGAIQSSGTLPFSILGDTFLKNVYAIFDVRRKRFGCVQRTES